MIPFENVDARLEMLGKDRRWLAEVTGRSPESIRAALAPNSPVAKKSPLIQRAITDAILKEEDAQVINARPVQGFQSIFLTDEQINRADQASRIVDSPSLLDFCREAIIFRSNEILSGKLDPLKPSTLHVVEDAAKITTFPEVILHHAAAGAPIDADVDIYTPTRDLGPGRFAVQLHGDSMAPRFPDGSIIIMRGRDSLNRPLLKKGEIYLFVIGGVKTVKIYDTRDATREEAESGIAYHSAASGKWKTRVLRSINPAIPEIIIQEDADWIGWLDKGDN